MHVLAQKAWRVYTRARARAHGSEAALKHTLPTFGKKLSP